MANWNGLQLTNKGIALQAKVQAGTQLHITKLKLGSGVVPGGTDIKTLNDLIAPEQNLGIGGKEAVDDYCKISSTISNTGLEAGYYVRELGVFAQDPDDGEVLYAYTTDGAPDYLPAGGGSTVISQEFSVMIAVDDVDNIEVDIDPAALATMGYVQLQITEHNIDEDAHEAAFDKHNADVAAHLDMVGATTDAAGKRGMVPAPAKGNNNRYLKSDGTWGEIDTMQGATSGAAGKSGLVPAPAAGENDEFLRGDGTWQPISNMKGASSNAAGASGLVPAPAAGDQGKALLGDGTWNVLLKDIAEASGTVTITKSDGSTKKITQILKSIQDGNGKNIDSTYAKKTELNAIEGIAVGDVIYRPFLMSGYVKANGATVNRADYPNLVAYANSHSLWTSNPSSEPWKYGTGNGSTTMTLPDYRNRVLQGGDNVVIISPGLPNITGKFNAQGNSNGGKFSDKASGAFYTNTPYSGNVNSGVGDVSGGYSFDASRVNSIYGAGSTVQPPAISLIPQIKY